MERRSPLFGLPAKKETLPFFSETSPCPPPTLLLPSLRAAARKRGGASSSFMGPSVESELGFWGRGFQPTPDDGGGREKKETGLLLSLIDEGGCRGAMS